MLNNTLDPLHWFVHRKERWIQSRVHYIPKWITPNHLSIFRFFLVIPLIWTLLKGEGIWAFGIFLFAVLLDTLDGPLARSRKTVSMLGTILDPLSDKIIVLSTLIVIQFNTQPPPLSEFLFLSIIILDGVLFLLPIFYKIVEAGLGARRVGSNIFGKTKFTLHAFGGLSLILSLDYPIFRNITTIILWVAVIFAVAAIIGHLTIRPESKKI